jgi:rhodanese-related sulfurtransferase
MPATRRHALAACLGLALAAAAAPALSAAGSAPVATLSADAAAPLPGAAARVLPDVRSYGEFAAGHLPGARNLPLDELPSRLAELEPWKDAESVVYCQTGRRAARALDALQHAGFPHRAHLAGDLQGWLAGGRPVAAGAGPDAAR